MPQGHLIIASGGTGGHFYPTLAIAKAYIAAGYGNVTLLVSGKHAASQLAIARQNGLPAQEVEAVRLPTSFLDLLCFPFRFLKCYFRARKTLRQLGGDALLGMGSFAAVPACMAWPHKKKPLFLHEGNAYMGRANRLFAGRARAIALSLPLQGGAQLRGAYSLVTGMPLRKAVLEAAAEEVSEEKRAQILTEFGLQPSRRTVLVFGGSQGAAAINRLLLGVLSLLSSADKEQLQFIVLTGTPANESMQRAFMQYGIPARIVASDPDIQKCYQASELVVCRAGASSICELSLFGKPMILIPLPTAADDHQSCNAATLAAAGAAVMLPQREATPDRFKTLLEDWLAKPERWKDYGDNARKFAHPEAAEAVTALIAET